MTQTPKHTRGEWSVNYMAGRPRNHHGTPEEASWAYPVLVTAISQGGPVICRAGQVQPNKHELDNATLIAAAPDLLEACAAIFGEIDMDNVPAHFRRGGPGSGGKLGIFLSHEQVEALTAAIAKATP